MAWKYQGACLKSSTVRDMVLPVPERACFPESSCLPPRWSESSSMARVQMLEWPVSTLRVLSFAH